MVSCIRRLLRAWQSSRRQRTRHQLWGRCGLSSSLRRTATARTWTTSASSSPTVSRTTAGPPPPRRVTSRTQESACLPSAWRSRSRPASWWRSPVRRWASTTSTERRSDSFRPSPVSCCGRSVTTRAARLHRLIVHHSTAQRAVITPPVSSAHILTRSRGPIHRRS